MWNTSWAKHKHIFYNPSWVRRKSGDKHKSAVERFIKLLKKEKKEGATKRVQKTKLKAEARLKKFGTTQEQVKKALEKKWLQDLIK